MNSKSAFIALGLAAVPAVAASPPPVMVAAAALSAVDVERTASFYAAVFGFQEIRRLDARPQFLEIVMKPGSDPDAARAAPGAAFILISRPADSTAEKTSGWARSHVTLVVPEMAPALARAQAQGGSVEVAPETHRGALEAEMDAHPSPVGFHVVAMIRDPAGNDVELLSPK